MVSISKACQILGQEIKTMTMAREVVKSLLVRATGKPPPGDDGDSRGQYWHAEFEQKGAEAHFAWLKRLGFSKKESLYIRWVTRNLSDNGEYMENFFKIFEQMKRQGPGSRGTTSSPGSSCQDRTGRRFTTIWKPVPNVPLKSLA